MLIVCPNCATSYSIDSASFGPAGRKVRCARCKSAWLAGGPPGTASVQGFVQNVIAEAQAEQTGTPPSLPGQTDQRDYPAAQASANSAPDDFGAESNTTVGASEPASDSHFEQEHPAGAEPPPEPEPERRIPAPDSPSIVPPMGHAPMRGSGGAELTHDDLENFAARRERLQAKRKTTRRASKWTALVLVLLGFNIAVIGARNDVVRFIPQTASLFAAIGLPVNLRSMSFENVKVTKEDADGVSVLLVEGDIMSTARSPVQVPRLRFAVRNIQGQEIYAWTALATKSILQPGEKLPFRSRLASPPADASDVMVRFFNSHDAASGSR